MKTTGWMRWQEQLQASQNGHQCPFTLFNLEFTLGGQHFLHRLLPLIHRNASFGEMEEEKNVIVKQGEAVAESTASPTKRKKMARCGSTCAEAYEGNLRRRLKKSGKRA
jgi:hypothetical protein